MTSAIDLLADAFTRIRDTVERTVKGLSEDELTARVDESANTIGWLVWHLTRVQDDHVAAAAGTAQVWHEGGWEQRFALPFAPDATGYGQTAAEVAQVAGVLADALIGYHRAVHDATIAYLRTLADDDLDRVVDESWNPPVTLAVRLVSVVSDDLQHAGQASFVKGVLARR